MFALVLLSGPTCKSGDTPAGDQAAESTALKQLRSVAGDDAAIVFTLRAAGWPAVRDALAKASDLPPRVKELLRAESTQPLLNELAGPELAKVLGAPGVRVSCGVGVIDRASTTVGAQLLGAVAAGRSAPEALGDARGRCAISGAAAGDVVSALKATGLEPVPTNVSEATALRDQDGLFLALREDSGAVIVGGRLAAAGGDAVPDDVDALVTALLEQPASATETPGLRSLALPGSLGGVLLRAEPTRRLGTWSGLRQLVAFLDEIPEQELMRAVARGTAFAIGLDQVVRDLPPDAVDAALVVAGREGRLALTTTYSLTAHGARVIDAALGDDVATRTVAMAPDGVSVGVRFDGAAAAEVVNDAAGGKARGASMEALANSGIWGYSEILAHAPSLIGKAGDQLASALTTEGDPSTLGEGDLARWSIDVTRAKRVFDFGFVSPAGIGVTRIDGVARRSGPALVASTVFSFGDAAAPAVTLPDFSGMSWTGPDAAPSARCLHRASRDFNWILEGVSGGRVPQAELATLILRLADARSCLGGDAAAEARLGEMLWAAKIALADGARRRWDPSTATVALAGACEQEHLPAACALMKRLDAAPKVGVVDREEGCTQAPLGSVVRVTPEGEGVAVWVGDERVEDLAGLAEAVKARFGKESWDKRAVVLIDPALNVIQVAPVLADLKSTGGEISVGFRVRGQPAGATIDWRGELAPGVTPVSPETPWRDVVTSLGDACSTSLALSTATGVEAPEAEDSEATEVIDGMIPPSDEPEGEGDAGLGDKKKTVPKMKLGDVTVKGFCDRDAVRRVLRRQLSAFRFCAEKAAPEPGTLGARFTIELSGAVGQPRIVENTVGGDDTAACVTRTLRRVRFPAPEGGLCVVNLQLDLSRD